MDKKYKLVGVRFYNLEDENFFRDLLVLRKSYIIKFSDPIGCPPHPVGFAA